MTKTTDFERDRYVQMLFRQLPGAVWTTDRDLNLTYVAGRLANNMSPRAKAGMSIYEIVGTRDPANRAIASHWAAMAGESQSFEDRMNGRWYRVFVEQLTDESGAVAGCIGASFDITEQRETHERLVQSEAMLAQAQRLAHIGSFEWDIASNSVTWSDELCRIHGLEPGTFEGTYETFLKRIYPEDVEQVKSSIFDALRKASAFVFEHRIVRTDGSVRTLQTRGDVIVGSDGHAVKMAGSCWDVTELREAMQRALFLADASRLLSSLDVEPALDSVAHLAVPFIGDGCAIDLLANGHPRRLLLVARESNESLNPQLQSAVMAGHSAIYSMGTRSCMAVPLVVKEAIEGSMTFIGPPMRRYEKADLEFVETLASRAALSVENARLYRQAREALKARDEFLTIAAHEIRGPITSIHMAVQGLQMGKASPGAMTKLFEIIQHEDRRLRRFVDELLDLANIQSGEMYFNFEDVDLGQIVREVATSLGPEIARSGSGLSITTEGRPVGQWDKYGLTQVVTNLLSNAVKFGEGKPITVTVREHEGRSALEVKDQGIGMEPETLGRIFNPFERGVSVRNYGGLGLGLYIVRTIVEGLGGVVQVESTPGQGSTFTVELRNARSL
jgi:PAS domain S-box-containing protein